ncbi:MAG TPA: cytochrome c peroxidase [Pirellulales bacterium]|jgi:cytochrome c peroxidase|nr:cytochrome c peroxidase [Pirellulales bacterium]
MSVTSLGEERPPPLPSDTLVEELPLDVLPPGATELQPDDNRLTAERVRLGRKLFFDPILSADRTVACASCHDPAHGFATAAPRAVGIHGRAGKRNAPSVLNRAAGKSFFWDGRAKTLEEQALEPITNPLELGGPLDEAMSRLTADKTYGEAFAAAYGEGVTAQNVGRALAAFQRVLLSGSNRVDRFQAGDAAALTDNERIGLWLFESRGQCWRCHRGANYSDELFHNTGVAWLQDEPDPGRYSVSHDELDRGRFKTPGLREVSRTAPYMHDGSLATLRDVVEYYNRGGTPNAGLDQAIRPLGLSAEQVDHLVEFLRALEGERSLVREPPNSSHQTGQPP